MQHKKYRERAKTIKSKLHKLFCNFYYATMERNIENYGQDNNSYNKRNLHSNEIKQLKCRNGENLVDKDIFGVS